jgi:hypothetical protein
MRPMPYRKAVPEPRAPNPEHGICWSRSTRPRCQAEELAPWRAWGVTGATVPALRRRRRGPLRNPAAAGRAGAAARTTAAAQHTPAGVCRPCVVPVGTPRAIPGHVPKSWSPWTAVRTRRSRKRHPTCFAGSSATTRTFSRATRTRSRTIRPCRKGHRSIPPTTGTAHPVIESPSTALLTTRAADVGGCGGIRCPEPRRAGAGGELQFGHGSTCGSVTSHSATASATVPPSGGSPCKSQSSRRRALLAHSASRALPALPSGWRDLNPRPPRPERGTLPSCATPRSTAFIGPSKSLADV